MHKSYAHYTRNLDTLTNPPPLDIMNDFINMPQRTAKQIMAHLDTANQVLIIPHQNPDGDALGSASALAHFLRLRDKMFHTFCASAPVAKYQKHPHLVTINTDVQVWEQEFDTIIVVDSGDLKYAGIKEHLENLPYQPVIINFDHHQTNNQFGHYNLVIPSASSTAEILYWFFRVNGQNITKEMATALLTGLITDTENFTNPGTTAKSLKVAGDLIRRGANYNFLRKWFLKDKPLNSLRLWGVALSRLVANPDYGLVYTSLSLTDFSEHGAEETEAEGIANFLNNTGDGKATLVLREMTNGLVKGSLRTTRADIDVSSLAKALGGGGHRKAAGFTSSASLSEVLAQIWVILEKLGWKE